MVGLTPCHSAAFAIASRGPLQWHHRQTKFHPNLLSASKLNRGKQTNTQTGRQTDDLINLLLFLKEGLLKIKRRLMTSPLFVSH
jgi:hypothetical protein